MTLKDKVALVTGASSGIGRSTALLLSERGAKVAMLARRRERLEENASKMNDALVVPADLQYPDRAIAAAAQTLEHYGHIDVLINCAGASTLCRSDAIDEQVLRYISLVNFQTPMLLTSYVARAMARRGVGHILNVVSPAGVLGVPFYAVYSATKAAMIGWTRALQAEWEGAGIHVTEYHPSLVATEINEAAKVHSQDDLKERTILREDLGWVARNATDYDPPEKIAAQITHCIEKPRKTAYASASVQIGMWLSPYSGARCPTQVELAKGFQARTGTTTFTEEAGHEDPAE